MFFNKDSIKSIREDLRGVVNRIDCAVNTKDAEAEKISDTISVLEQRIQTNATKQRDLYIEIGDLVQVQDALVGITNVVEEN